MEAREHISWLKRQSWFIVSFGIVTAIIAGVVSWQRPAMYKTVVDFEIDLVNRTATTDYQYGSYYDLKGAEIFTQHLMGLLRSPAVIEDIYQTAKLPYTIDNLDLFTSQFRTDQVSAQAFSVTYSKYQHDDAAQLAAAMQTVLAKHTSLAERNSTDDSLFDLRSNPAVIVYTEPNIWLSALVALVAGWLLAIVLVYLKRYLQ